MLGLYRAGPHHGRRAIGGLRCHGANAPSMPGRRPGNRRPQRNPDRDRFSGMAGTPLNSSEGNYPKMKRVLRRILRNFSIRSLITAGFTLLLAAPAFAQTTGNSPWENAVNVLETAFTSTIARGLSLVAIVVSGLTFAFGEGGSKRVLAGVLFGVGMAIAAVNFLAWLFPGS